MIRAADDFATIAARAREIREAETAAIVGCGCPRDVLGKATHALDCALYVPPTGPSPSCTAADLLARVDERLAELGLRVEGYWP